MPARCPYRRRLRYHDIVAKLTPLPLYLTPEQHRALKELSKRTGRSMAELVRTLLDERLLQTGPPTNLADLAGVVDLGRPTDIARDRDSLLANALDDLR